MGDCSLHILEQTYQNSHLGNTAFLHVHGNPPHQTACHIGHRKSVPCAMFSPVLLHISEIIQMKKSQKLLSEYNEGKTEMDLHQELVHYSKHI